MRTDNRFESVDRDMSSWVLSCVHNGTRFYLSDSFTYTDRIGNARRYRWADHAEGDAAEYTEPGFALKPFRVAAAYALAAGSR